MMSCQSSEHIEEHLTAAIVSNNACFQHKVLSNSLNGTTYVGLRARTTGAPQNHWFGPAGDPRYAPSLFCLLPRRRPYRSRNVAKG